MFVKAIYLIFIHFVEIKESLDKQATEAKSTDPFIIADENDLKTIAANVKKLLAFL